MAIWRLQTSFFFDGGLPRDVMQINPVFNSTTGGTSGESLASDLATALDAKLTTWTVPTKIMVRAYDAQGTKPVYPVAEEIRHTSTIRNATVPREVALCLSFFSTRNVPGRRGRLYIPATLWTPTSSIGARPTSGDRGTVATLAPVFENLGGLDVDWSVYSQRDHNAFKVTDWFIDDEWDTQRRRGLRATTRTVGTTSE